jgi:hypothetical protein
VIPKAFFPFQFPALLSAKALKRQEGDQLVLGIWPKKLVVLNNLENALDCGQLYCHIVPGRLEPLLN